MRKAELIRAGDELYEVIQRFSVYKFSTEITGGKADDLKKWYGVDKILRSQQTNEYLFVNKIEDAEIIEEHN
jgi:hypothetical protein